MFVGKDTHALSEPACRSVLKYLVANDVEVIVQDKIMALLQRQVFLMLF